MKNKYRIEGDVVYIETKYKNELMETLIDLDDFDLINSHKGTWSVNYYKSAKNYYTRSKLPRIDGKQQDISIHRLIMNVTDPKIQVDHINHNTLDNRKSQLRLVNNQENAFNTKNAKGYYWNNEREKFSSEINISGKKIFLGRFDNEEDARKAYLEAKKKYHVMGGVLNYEFTRLSIHHED